MSRFSAFSEYTVEKENTHLTAQASAAILRTLEVSLFALTTMLFRFTYLARIQQPNEERVAVLLDAYAVYRERCVREVPIPTARTMVAWINQRVTGRAGSLN